MTTDSQPTYDERLERVRTRLVAAQTAIRESGDVAYAFTIGGDDRRGVHRLLTRLFEWMDARNIRACVHGRARGVEREQPVLMRMWRDCPQKGQGAIFVRAAPNQILVDRIRGRTKRKAFERQLDQLEKMETLWALDGIKIVKLWLTVSPEVHSARRETPTDLDRWRRKQFDPLFLKDLQKGGEVARAIRERTDHPNGPWTVLEGSSPRERDLAAAELIAAKLEEAVQGITAVESEPQLDAISTDDHERVAAAFAPARPIIEPLADDAYKERLRSLREAITDNALDALHSGRSTVVVLQGWDAAGKGGAIRRALPALDPGFYRVISTAAPNDVERGHPYLWRFWRDIPHPGHIRFFDRSWYGRVLVERVEGFADEVDWKRAYAEIVDFERQLVDAGTTVVKVWLDISEDEQLRRFTARENSPEKRYKITDEDWRNREKRPAYESAVHEMVARTHRKWAPWHVVNAENKRAGRLRFLEILRDALGG